MNDDMEAKNYVDVIVYMCACKFKSILKLSEKIQEFDLQDLYSLFHI